MWGAGSQGPEGAGGIAVLLQYCVACALTLCGFSSIHSAQCAALIAALLMRLTELRSWFDELTTNASDAKASDRGSK